jgi:hypothetical protein
MPATSVQLRAQGVQHDAGIHFTGCVSRCGHCLQTSKIRRDQRASLLHFRSPRRWRVGGDARMARSVLECASPLALWEGGRAGRAEVKRRRDARGGAKLFHLFDDEHLDWIAANAES